MPQVLVGEMQLGTIFSEPNKHGRMQVWLDSVTVYEFIPTVLGFFYQKSGDAGVTWGTRVQLTQAVPINVDIYYERWGSLSAPPIVHVVSHDDAGTRGLDYNHLNLATEVQGTPVRIVNFAADPAEGVLSVCVARNGDIHVYLYGGFAGNYHYISTDGGVNFSLSGSTLPVGQGDKLVLVPDFESSDTADIAAILYDYSATDLLRFRWDSSAGAWTTSTTIDASVAQVFTPNLVAVAVNRSTGHIKVLAFVDAASPRSLKAYDVYGTTVTARTNVLTSVANAEICAIGINLQGHVYALYSRADHVYYKVSTDDMVTWGAETQYSSVAASAEGTTVTSIHIEPTFSVAVFLPAYLWADRRLWVETPAVSAAPEQFRLMLAEETEIPEYVATIYPPDRIGGTIGGLTAERLRRELKPVAGLPLKLHLSCRGGVIPESLDIAAVIAGWPAPTEAVVQLAASSAVFLALACNRVLMEPTGRFYVHMPYRVNPAGEIIPNEAEAEARYLALICEALARRSGYPASSWEELIRDRGDVWIDAHGAVSLGLADGVLTEPSGVWRIPESWSRRRSLDELEGRLLPRFVPALSEAV